MRIIFKNIVIQEYCKDKSPGLLTVQEKFLQEVLCAIGTINSCAATAARAVNTSGKAEGQLEHFKFCLTLTSSSLEKLKNIAKLMNDEFNQHILKHPEVLELARLKDKEGGIVNPGVEMLNLVNEQVKQHSHFQTMLKQLEDEQIVAKDHQLTEPVMEHKKEQIC